MLQALLAIIYLLDFKQSARYESHIKLLSAVNTHYGSCRRHSTELPEIAGIISNMSQTGLNQLQPIGKVARLPF